MQMNVKEFLNEAGITEEFYPGKRMIHKLQQNGEFKSHCLVFDWRTPDKIRIELKAGLSGRDLPTNKLKKYPVSFQTPTYIDIEVLNDNDEEETGEEGKGKSSGGSSKSPAKKKGLESMVSVASQAFGDVIKGKVPELGQIVEMVVMGTEVAKEAYGRVLSTLVHQIHHAKIAATDLLAHAGDFVTKYTPPSFLKPKGDENAVYKYDREKNANIGYTKPAVG